MLGVRGGASTCRLICTRRSESTQRARAAGQTVLSDYPRPAAPTSWTGHRQQRDGAPNGPKKKAKRHEPAPRRYGRRKVGSPSGFPGLGRSAMVGPFFCFKITNSQQFLVN
jgi:hypothetical protein